MGGGKGGGRTRGLGLQMPDCGRVSTGPRPGLDRTAAGFRPDHGRVLARSRPKSSGRPAMPRMERVKNIMHSQVAYESRIFRHSSKKIYI